MLGLIQLPDYLDRLQLGQRAAPLDLLPPINDIRACRGARPLSEAELLVASSSSADAPAPSPETREALARLAGKARPYFHRYLLQSFREETSREGLSNLGHLFNRLQEDVQDGIFYELFRAVEAMAEGLKEVGIARDLAAKMLLGRLDRVMKPLMERADNWPELEARELLSDLLSQGAIRQSTSPLGERLQQIYGLHPETGPRDSRSWTRAPSLGADVLPVLIAESEKDLELVKDVLDLYARGERDNPRALLQVGSQLDNLANTLAVVATDDLVDRLRRCAKDLTAMGQGAVVSDDRHLIVIADELVSAEAQLGEMRKGGDRGVQDLDAQNLVASTLGEIRIEMAKAKEAIGAISVVDGPGDVRAMGEVPELIHRVANALRVLGESDAADVLDLVVAQVKQRFLGSFRQPVQQELDLLAQAISGIELYMDGLSESEPYRPDLIADARGALEQLAGIPVPAGPWTVDSETEPEVLEGADEPELQRQDASAGRIAPEFLNIFLEEAEQEQRAICDQFALWWRDSGDENALSNLRRSFHTLKGSGGLVGAQRVGELARAMEMLLNRVIDRTVGASPAVIACIDDAVALLPSLIAAEADGGDIEVGELIERAESLAVALPEQVEPDGEREEAPSLGKPAKVIPWPTAVPRPEIDPDGSVESTEELGAESPIEVRTPDSAVSVRRRESVTEEAELAVLADADEELLDIFRAEAREHLAVLRAFLAGCAAGGRSAVPDDSVVRSLHTLKGSASMIGADSASEASGALERLFRALKEREAEADPRVLDLLSRGADALQIRVDQLPGGGRELETLRSLAGEASTRLGVIEMPPTAQEVPEAALPDAEPPEAELPEAELPEAELPEAELRKAEMPEPAVTGITSASALTPAELGELQQDPELVNLFLEDARDILDNLDQSLRDLQLSPAETGPLEELQRLLHTLKGSARLSGLSAIGDLSHAFESLLTAITNGEAKVDEVTLELAQRTLDTLSDQADCVAAGNPVRSAHHLVQALALALEEGLAGAGAPDVVIMAPSPVSGTAEKASAAIPSSFAGPVEREMAGAAESPAPQIRVRADLLNRLVNNAGEISIYRARLAQHSGLLGFRLGELDHTVDRLREQLRQLEIETEAQILYRFERESETSVSGREVFDPLELDRFSTLQQRSRSLAETVNDLVSLRTLLSDLQSETEALLQQQARIADDLQDGLLRTRMVPFAQVVPRLHRVVRQTAQQLGKDARLEVFGPEVELDRSIQERIVAPLEHLLRNAVAHGIEPPERREAQGKAAAGVVSLMLTREGNDVLVTVADDGAGLDLGAIRRRAVERGLLEASADAGEEEISQLILESGFSTAQEVTQIAGRGVGLDVVNSEIKQLSGSFTLDTQPGRGTSFTVRLPLTLAIIEALLVETGGEIFAVPHTTIEAVSRIAHLDLEANYKGEGEDFSYAGHDYRVMYLGTMLGSAGAPDLGDRRWLPLLLTRFGDQRVAFHVDNLLGSQRVVVKPLGPQLSSIRWLGGGTILPDGRVAMILDPLALIRSGVIHDYRPPLQAGGDTLDRRICVMVVDDSLTVRRVTSRMLHRQNMDVITAQDGIEALTLLEERIPDVVLLDIEMPRMDGYELTRHIRRSPRLKGIPLIMITSRTGDKHRRHAEHLGVDRYLGKPYQDADLLDEISSVLVEASS
ncbi:MAG: Hpt domain-containing protein [Pseudomonadota bacterium]|nr:Hpt domain-containing protein [Pseudomonadota bacterium]